MDITPFIRELLFTNDCVIIPGFGGFIANYTPARIDRESSTFYPPFRQISFNRNLNNNDGLLIGKISSSLSVNYGDARAIAEEFSSSLRRRLEKGEKVVFEHIGSFVNNDEGNVQFEPEQGVNYLLGVYGLESFQFPAIGNYDVRKRITEKIEKKTAVQLPLRKILWRAAIIVPLLGVIVAVPFTSDLLKSRLQSAGMNPLIQAEIEDNRQAVDNSEALAVVIPPAIDSQPEQVVPVEISEPVRATPQYYIIAGSFKSRENASHQADLLREAGYTPTVIDAENGFFRVSATECTTLEEANSMKSRVSASFPGSWVRRIR